MFLKDLRLFGVIFPHIISISGHLESISPPQLASLGWHQGVAELERCAPSRQLRPCSPILGVALPE